VLRFPSRKRGVITNDLMGLCELDHKGNLRSTMSLGGFEELYDSFRGFLIIFHHLNHSCAVNFDSGAF
jgi:hypothetical protein